MISNPWGRSEPENSASFQWRSKYVSPQKNLEIYCFCLGKDLDMVDVWWFVHRIFGIFFCLEAIQTSMFPQFFAGFTADFCWWSSDPQFCTEELPNFRTSTEHTCQWIGLRENLQETMVFTIKYRGFLQKFPIIQFYDTLFAFQIFQDPLCAQPDVPNCPLHRDIFGFLWPPHPAGSSKTMGKP